MPAIISPEECAACAACVETCEQGAIQVREFAVVQDDLCTECGACTIACPRNAITVVLEPDSESQLERVRRDPVTVTRSDALPPASAQRLPQSASSYDTAECANAPQPAPRAESFLTTVTRIAEQIVSGLVKARHSTPHGYDAQRPGLPRGNARQPRCGGMRRGGAPNQRQRRRRGRW